MGFPRNVRNEILIDSARHCCICHRYKGVKVEVHHIEPESSGGTNTYDNGIALCFDCHADAGHYNPSHPRGTKFSPAELKKAKENWFHIVKDNNIQQATDPEKFYCRYYLCKNYEQLVEISQGDLSRFPVENPLLIQNEVIDSLRKVIKNHPNSYRYANAWGESLPNKEYYLQLYPDSKSRPEINEWYPYFDVIRTPSKDELEALKKKDGLLYLMLRSDLATEKISRVGSYCDGCEGSGLQEEFIFRKLWCSFLAITNLSDKPVTLDSIAGTKYQNNEVEFGGFNLSNDNPKHISLPKAPVPHNNTVLLPLAIILPPFHSKNRDSWSETYDEHRHTQIVSHEGVNITDYSDYLVYGTQIVTKAINYKIGGHIELQEIHDFDLSNMYTIDRSWECGSCPHLFLSGHEITYCKEILSHCCQKNGKETIRIPENVNSIIIAEIEDEITEINYLKINGKTMLENKTLRKNEYVVFHIASGALIEICGKYIPNKHYRVKVPSGVKRNDIIREFLYSSNTA